MSNQLPKTIYVFRQEGSGEDWLQPEEELRECASLEESRVVGVYELKETMTVSAEVVVKNKK
jgi:hypothetical protein